MANTEGALVIPKWAIWIFVPVFGIASLTGASSGLASFLREPISEQAVQQAVSKALDEDKLSALSDKFDERYEEQELRLDSVFYLADKNARSVDSTGRSLSRGFAEVDKKLIRITSSQDTIIELLKQ